jgi:hypothetical protein
VNPVDWNEALLVLAGGLATLAGSLVTMIVSRATRRQAFQLAALGKRLDAHQHAYTLWWRLMLSLSKRDELQRRHEEALIWWQEHCLFLDGRSRRAFGETLNDIAIYSELDPLGKKEARAKAAKVLDLLIRGVELPSLGANEFVGKDDVPKP